jgi:hypothetical protein
VGQDPVISASLGAPSSTGCRSPKIGQNDQVIPKLGQGPTVCAILLRKPRAWLELSVPIMYPHVALLPEAATLVPVTLDSL